MWITMRRQAGQRKWRHAHRDAEPSDYSVLSKAGVELSEIAHVEIAYTDGTGPESPVRVAAADPRSHGEPRQGAEDG